MSEVLKMVSNTVTDEKVRITVSVKPQSWWQKYYKPKVRVFEVGQICFGSLIRISGIIVSIDKDFFKEKMDKNMLLDWNYRGIHMYGESIVDIVAIGLHNKREMPPKALTEFIKSNFTTEDMNAVMSVIVKQMDIGNFMNTIISARGLSIYPAQDADATNAAAVSL